MSTYLGNQLLSGVATNTISNAHSLFDFKWTDHILNEMSWLRNDLQAAFDAGTTGQTEVIDGLTVYYDLAPDGHKIISAEYPSAVQVAEQVYDKTGVSWYYILDTTNQRFKLPRELPITDKSKGNGMTLGLTNGIVNTGIYIIGDTSVAVRNCVEAYNTSIGTNMSGLSQTSSNGTYGITADPTKSGIISHRANENGQQYLYFYVGEYSQSQAEQVATLNVEMFNNKADKNLVNTGYLTNCITEIPQDIKLELDTTNHNIILKAGSRVWYPDGFETDGTTPKFSYYTLESDRTATTINPSNYNDAVIINLYDENGSYMFWGEMVDTYSGSTSPTLTGHRQYWYDTTNNIIKYYDPISSSWINEFSGHKFIFPLGLFTVEENIGFTEIQQIFNGFGYFGSTIYVLPGVKGLIPNGRNPDGTLKTTNFISSKVITRSDMSISRNDLTVSVNPNGYLNYDNNFHIDENGYLRTHANNIWTELPFANYTTGTDGRIGYFSPKKVYKILDCSDSSYISKCSMISNKYVDLTLGASGTSYIAPANGYVTISKIVATTSSASVFRYVMITNTTTGVSYSTSGNYMYHLTLDVPVRKGDSYEIYYDATGTTNYFKFYYAEGEI